MHALTDLIHVITPPQTLCCDLALHARAVIPCAAWDTLE